MRVYKYLSAEFGLQDIEKRHIKISEYPHMNDPFELRGIVLPPTWALEVLLPFFQKEIGVLCSSSKWEQPLSCGLTTPTSTGVFVSVWISLQR